GAGHVIAHNAVAFFHDGISVCTHGVPDAKRDDWAVAIDIYNNDIHVTGDDFIEADGGVHNIRVMRNRGMNAAHTGLSAQPTYDYDGYRPNRGVDMQYVWNGPRPGMMVDYDRPQNQAQRFKTLTELTAASGAEAHGIEVDYDIFTSVRPPSPPDSSVPSRPY